MGVAAVLIVPTLITAANPELAYAKTTSSKKVSAKAKSVIAKIKAINPKKSNYVTKTKSAVNAYKKLSSKDKKMVYNYGTLKKHWTIVQNRKAKQVIASIKAINPKKSDYVLKTKSALSAYNKLSKTDKKKVTNYSTLKKHWKKIQPYLKKVDAFNKSVATLNKTNFTTKSVNLEKQYDNLDSITKAAVPSTTLKKLSYYSDVVETKKLVFRTLEAGSTNESNTNNGSDTSSNTTPEDGTKILTIINAYNKLSGAQKTLLDDLLTADSSNTNTTDEEKKETARNNLKRYLALEDLIKIAAGIEKKYSALQPLAKAKAKDLYDLYFNEYEPVADKTISYTDKKDYKLKDFIPEEDFAVIDNIDNAYSSQKEAKDNFTKKVNELSSNSSSSTDIDGDNGVIKLYTELQKPKNASIAKYPDLAPIDLVDKKTITTYNKFAPIPALVDNLKDLNLSPLNSLTPGSLKTSEVSTLADLLTQYNKLGSDQKSIVRNGLTSNNAKDYLSEAKNISNAQSIDKSYESAIKNKAKSSYFTDLKKVSDAYTAAPADVQRFVVNAANIIKIMDANSDYNKALDEAKALQQAIEALNENSILSGNSGINAVIGKYKIMSKQIPTPMSLVDASALKTYNQFAAIPDVVKLVNKIPTKVEPTEGNAYGYKTTDINNILLAIKPYKKLGSIQKTIVDNETNKVDKITRNPSIANLADDESYIKEAQKIDSAYLKLKKSSKTYSKDAKKVYESYGDISENAIKYLVYKDKIAQLKSAYEKPQKIADDFAALVNPLSKNKKIDDVNKAVNYYNDYIAPNTQASDLVDKAVMKKYNEYAPVSNVDKLLNLIIGVDTSSQYITPTNVYYIQKATIAYNALKPDPKMIIDAADRKKFPFLYETKNILDAVAIDKAYEKIKPTDDKYELELIDIYREMYVSAPFAQKYVTHKDEFDRVEELYSVPIKKAEEFETSVDKMSQVSKSNGTPTMEMVRNLEAQYYDLVNYNKFGTKYKFPLKDLIKDETLADYNKFILVLRIQDIAKTLYVSYGKLFNEENVDFDYVKDSFYCKKAEDSSDQNVKNDYKDNCKRRDEYLADSNKYKVGYTVSNSRYGQPIKISNPNDIKLIYKAIDYFQQLDSTQVSILKKAPSSQKDYYYEDRYKGKHKDEKYEEKEIVHPSIPMSDGEIKNFLKAQEIDKEYEALKPSSKTYIQDAIALYYKFIKAGKPVQLYVIHEKDLNYFRDGFGQGTDNKLDKLIKAVDDFVVAVKLLSNDSKLTDIVDGVDGVVDQYNKFNEAQLSVIEQGILTKYNAYAPIAEIVALTPAIPASDKKYSDADITDMLKSIAIYKKLAKDPKVIIDVKNDPYKYLTQEADIKAAQKVDNAFKKLDKTDDKYVTNLKKVDKDFEVLSDTAKDYVTSDIEGALKLAVYSTPKGQAEAFEKLIVGDKSNENDPAAWLNMKQVPYEDIANAVKVYKELSSKAKSLVDDGVMKIYNKYAPVVTIVETLEGINVPETTKIDSWATTEKTMSDLIGSPATGFYKDQGDVGTKILDAIQLYNKLGSDQKEIVSTIVSDTLTLPTDKLLTKDQFALLNESSNIKAAQALDKKIAAIKPKSTGYVKSVIDATKTLNVMPIEQRIYLQNVDILKGYLVDSKTQKSTQTQKAIDDLTKFEQGVQQVDNWTSEMKNENGNIAACTDHTEPCNTTITKKMGELVTLFKQLNTPRLVDGSEITLASLIDRTKLARYQYFRAIYDVIDGLEK